MGINLDDFVIRQGSSGDIEAVNVDTATGLSGGGTTGVVDIAINVIPIANGGTGSITADLARDALGCVKIHSTAANAPTQITTTTASRNYSIQHMTAGTTIVNVPWTDTNTTYSLATNTVSGLCQVLNTVDEDSVVCEEAVAGRRYKIQHDNEFDLSVCVPWVEYVHPTTEGNIHLPSGGRQGDYISWASSGTGQWRTFPPTISPAQASAIASNVTGVATNVTDIASIVSAMSTDTERLAAVASLTTAFTNADATLDGALTASISTNATNIATNATNIAANVSDITATENATATNATNITTNAASIATNVTAIAANTSKAVQNEPLLLASGIGYVASPAANYYYVGNGVYGWSHHNWAGVRTGGRSTGGGTPSIEDGTTWASAKPAINDQWAQVEDKTGNCGIIVPVDLTGLALKIQTRSTGGNELMSFFLATGPQTCTTTNNLMTIVAVGESSVTQGVWLVKDLTCTRNIADDQAIFIGFGLDAATDVTSAIKMNFSLIGYKA